jgi:hypothetical protein
MAQRRQAVREMRLVWETEHGNFVRSDLHIMDEIAKVLGKVNGIHVAFAFFDVQTGKRLRSYGPFGDASPELKKLIEIELAETEDVPA